ncbi:hypothetical protein [Sphingomonas sp.]|uniref:hypothetical protein n=1 Tax=Sphingomonas sp. TaxID=28214 RepID=UPI0037513142
MMLDPLIERGMALIEKRVEERLAEAEAILNEVSVLMKIERDARGIVASGPDLMRVMLEDSQLRLRGRIQ